jgi:hypothetical protein
MPNVTRNDFKILNFSLISKPILIILFSEEELYSAELLQAQKPSVPYTVKICLNFSCHRPYRLKHVEL